MDNHERAPRADLGDQDAPRAALRAELGAKVLDAAPVLIVLLDPGGAIQFVNPFFERLTGYRLDEIHGKDWFATVAPEHEREHRRALLRQTFESASVGGLVTIVVTRAGVQRDIEWTYDVLRDAQARPVSLLAIGHDVTERKAVQDALRASEQRLADANRLTNTGVCQFDPATSARWWSDELYRIAGIPVGTTVTQELFQSVIHPDDRDLVHNAIAAALAEGTVECEYRLVQPSGEVRDIHGRARTTYDAAGKPTAVTGTNQDITERKRTQEAARRASELLASVVAGAPIVLYALDRDGRFTVSEGRALEKLGLKPGQMVGASVFEAYGYLADLRDVFERALSGEQNVLWSPTVNDTDFDVVYVPSVDARGRINGVIGVAFDVTARNRAEAELRASVVTQQQLVAELRDADRRKNDFIAMLSHELRNPLSAICSGLDVYDRAAPGSASAQRASAVVRRQAGQLARLVDDLLDVSRITQGKIQLQRAPLDLDDLMRSVVDDHQSLFTGRGVRLEATLAGTPAIVRGDAARLTQVIGNLLHNAAKFTPAGGVTRVSVARDLASGSVVLCVADTGAGIDATMIERIFQPFAQSERTLARSMGGLGLGLTLVQGLVRLHGGDVSVHSDGEGRGAEFIVRLPLEGFADLAAPSPRTAAPGDTRQVLVIEDNPDVAEMLASIIELEGHCVRTVHDGASGVRVAHELRPDLVLCDLGLPDITGYDVARELRRDDTLRSTLLVALTGYAAAEDVARARSAGFDRHLPKPVALDRLRGVLDAIRNQRRGLV
jgi:PAS domain S-box-containing protein